MHLQFKKIFTVPHHPQANGTIERMMRTITGILKPNMFKVDNMSWDQMLPSLVYAYNVTVHSVIHEIPFLVWFGRLPHSINPVALLPQTDLGNVSEYRRSVHAQMWSSYETIRSLLDSAAKRSSIRHEASRVMQNWKVGDVVWYNDPAESSRRRSRKLACAWTGPHMIKGISPNGKQLTILAPMPNDPERTILTAPERLRPFQLPLYQPWFRSGQPNRFPQCRLQHRAIKGTQKKQYKVRWISLSPMADSWEDEDKLPLMTIHEYWHAQRGAQQLTNTHA